MAVRLSRRKITGYVAQQLVDGCDMKDLVPKLASFLVDNRRIKELDLIIRDVECELGQRGVILARVTSAHELSQSTRDAVTGFIESQTGAKDIQLEQFIEPKVLGGVRIDLPGQQFDGTIARKLLTLRTSNKE